MNVPPPLQLGKHHLARGLTWAALPGMEGVSPIKEIRRFAAEQQQRFGALYESAAARYHLAGFPLAAGQSTEGQIPAAIWLAESVQRPTLYIEAIDERRDAYWVAYAPRQGVIDTRSDRVLTDDDTAHLVDDILADADGDLDLVIGGGGGYPSTHMIERAPRRHAQFIELLDAENVPTQRIRQLVGISRTTKLIGAAAVVAAIVLGGGFGAVHYWKLAQTEAARAAAEAAAAAEQERLAALIRQLSAEAISKALHDDTATPPPESVVAACVKVASGYPAQLGGWRLMEVNCAPGASSSAKYHRDTSFVPGLITQETLHRDAERWHLTASTELMSDIATVTGVAMELEPRVPLTRGALPTMVDYGRHLSSRLQAAQGTMEGLTVNVVAPAPRQISFDNPATPGVPAVVPSVEGYGMGSLTIAGTAAWQVMALPLDDPAISVTSLIFKFDATGLSWQLSANFVARLG